MNESSSKNRLIYLFPILVFVVFAVWWLYLHFLGIDSTRDMRQIWGATYQILALYGGIVGLFIANRWGGFSSLVGRIILAFSIGLLLQVFGQSYSSYYVYHYVAESPPYPAIGDIGFFGSVVAYIYGVILLCKISGFSTKIKTLPNKVLTILVPVLILLASYWYFLSGYEFDWSSAALVFLDFGYPLGQALYVSLAILALIYARNVLGGLMKRPITLLVIALIFQYFCDTFFAYEAHAGTWYVGNINDLLYCISYFFMSLAIINLGSTFLKVKES